MVMWRRMVHGFLLRCGAHVAAFHCREGQQQVLGMHVNM